VKKSSDTAVVGLDVFVVLSAQWSAVFVEAIFSRLFVSLEWSGLCKK